jgi:hypothetical protein
MCKIKYYTHRRGNLKRTYRTEMADARYGSSVSEPVRFQTTAFALSFSDAEFLSFGDIAWPAKIPDLSVHNHFLYGGLKAKGKAYEAEGGYHGRN